MRPPMVDAPGGDAETRIEELRRSEAYLAEGQRISHTGTWAVNLKSGEIYWSQEVFRIYGLDPSTTTLSQSLAFQLAHPEDRAFVQEAFEKSLRDKSDYSVEHRAIVAGDVKYLHALGRPVRNESGDLIEYIGSVVDLTERKLAEIKLRDASEKLQGILDGISDTFFAFDAEWRFTYFNKRAEEQVKRLGRDPASLIGKVTWDEIKADPATEAVFRRAKSEGVMTTYELFYPPLGEWVENRIFPSDDGGVVVFQTYVTERKRAEENSRESERRFRLLAETIPHQVWSYRFDGTADYFNQRWLDYTGLTWEEAQRTGGHERLHPDDRERVDKMWHAASARREPWEIELRLLGRDGRYRRFLSRGVPFCSDSGEILRWFGTNTDVEDRRQAAEASRETQTELSRATRLTTLDELMATMAHELNQPLAAVVANTGAALRWLERDGPNIDEATQAMKRVLRDAGRIGDLIASVRNLLKRSVTEHTRIDIAGIIQEVLMSLSLEISKYQIVVRQSCADNLPQPLGSKVELEQVVLNLMMNAIEAMAAVTDRPRGLGITCKPHESHAGPGMLVAIEDSGVGLSPQVISRLFDPFYTTKSGGLGMGLSISRSIIGAHGGVLSAKPNAGCGATFQFVLPI